MDGVATSEEVVNFLFLKHVSCYTITASMFLIIYDSFLTFGQEVEYVWRTPCSPPKLVYFIHRYSSIIFAIIHLLGMTVFQLTTWYSWLSTLLVQLVVQIWLYAIFNKNRQLLFATGAASLTFGILTCVALSLTVTHLRIVHVHPVCIGVQENVNVDSTSTLNEIITAVSATNVPSFIVATLLPFMGLSLIMLMLLAYKVFVTFYSGPDRTHKLAVVLVRDSVLYCLLIFVVGLFNALLVTLAPIDLVQAGVGFGIALPSIASSRILLNLREVDRKRERQTDVRGICVEQWETIFHVT